MCCLITTLCACSHKDFDQLGYGKLKSKKIRLPSNNNSASITVLNNSINNINRSSQCLVGVLDVWCGPRIGVTTDVASVDCVVSRMPPVSTRDKVDRVDLSSYA
ncbi:Uncharacterized protein Adt_17841 [Abeliophyllum distichum]|uniref:Uncharacterized protein n=1 Tax=Abeliophyllum distichum TaxID=126358 RepID=A0ABD1THN6_9LAMI